MHLTSLMGPLSWPQPRRTLAYEMPIRTARFLPRAHGKAPMGAAPGLVGSGNGSREDTDRRMRVTPQHCVHWTARSPGHTVRHALQYLHRIVAGVLLPMFMAKLGALLALLGTRCLIAPRLSTKRGLFGAKPSAFGEKNLPTSAVLALKRLVREWHTGQTAISLILPRLRALRSFLLTITHRYQRK